MTGDWIAVTDRLPEPWIEVLAWLTCNEEERMVIAKLAVSLATGQPYWSGCAGNPTHWMPLPEPPIIEAALERLRRRLSVKVWGQ